MKIIKQGKPINPIYRFTCPDCDCVYEVEEHELRYMDGDGPYPGYDYTLCPNCKRLISVSSAEKRMD
jgi:hypothetical protein